MSLPNTSSSSIKVVSKSNIVLPLVRSISFNDTIDDIAENIVFNTTELLASASSNTNENELHHNDMLQLSLVCFKGIIFGTIIIGAVLGNALVIISVQRNRKLR